LVDAPIRWAPLTGKDLKQRAKKLVDLAEDKVQGRIEPGNNAYSQEAAIKPMEA
jgi:hypothetical protein